MNLIDTLKFNVKFAIQEHRAKKNKDNMEYQIWLEKHASGKPLDREHIDFLLQGLRDRIRWASSRNVDLSKVYLIEGPIYGIAYDYKRKVPFNVNDKKSFHVATGIPCYESYK